MILDFAHLLLQRFHFTFDTTFTARKVQAVVKNGIIILTNSKTIIVNGENTVMKHLTDRVSNELTEAIFPVAKNENTA